MQNDDAVEDKPTQKKIVRYLRYRREKSGEVNNLDGVYDYIKPRLAELMSDEELANFPIDKTLYFGYTGGVGSEKDPYRVYWCSKQTLINMAEFACTDHLDCTYKILKYYIE